MPGTEDSRFLFHSFLKMINPTSPPLKLRGGREGLFRCRRFTIAATIISVSQALKPNWRQLRWEYCPHEGKGTLMKSVNLICGHFLKCLNDS